MGKYGSFTFDSADADVMQYTYRITGQDGTSLEETVIVPTSGGAARTVQLLPQSPGVNSIEAQTRDDAGNWSAKRTYLFMVRAGEPERMVWGMDDEIGAGAVTGEGEPWNAALTTGATPGADGVVGGAVEFDGQGGRASTVTPVLDISKSFSVSVWARLPEGGLAAAGTAVSQTGLNASGFALGVDPATGWFFSRAVSDTAGAATVRARQGVPPALGEWTNVTGVFDNLNRKLLLYVDGSLVASTAFTGPWEARGATTLGASGSGSFFTGRLDEVQLYDYWLRPGEVAQLTQHQPVTETYRPAKAVWSMDEAADATSVAGHSQQTSAHITGGVELGVEGIRGTAASFDGTSGYAATTQPVLDTHQSFAVSLWAWLPSGMENRYMAVATQGGANSRGFWLYHRPNGGGWTFLRTGSDAPDSAHVDVRQNPCGTPPTALDCPAAGLGTWAHVVGVYDMDAETISLYVNGKLEETAPFTSPWEATGPLMLGAGVVDSEVRDRFGGKLDDVRLFDRVITASEVWQLFEQRPLVASRWQFEESGAGTTPDALTPGNPLTLQGDSHIGPGWIDTSALVLDGVDDHASTPTVPVDTTASFTVAGWAQAAALSQGGATLISAGGEHHSAFSVRFVPDAEAPGWGTWELIMPDEDSSTATVTRVSHPWPYFATDWAHVAVVYDGFRREVKLYVNGYLIDTPCHDGEEGDCDVASRAENVLTFEATESLEVGRARVNAGWSEYWPGSVDDLWTFKGALNAEQVAWLSTQWWDIPTEIPYPD